MANEYVINHSQSKSMPNDQFAELIAAVLSKGKPFRFQAKGYSMSPFIQNGDIVTISPLPRNILLGKVIAIFDSKKHLYLHRVVNIECDRFLIRGDNISVNDGWFSQTEMLGCVTAIERQSKIIRIGLGSERFFIAFLSANDWLIPIIAFSRKILSIKKVFQK